jgi:Tol biopolymer transport system component
LVTNDLNSLYEHVYVRDIAAARTTLASANTNGVAGNGNSYLSGISANGRFILFYSYANDLVPFDTNATSDIFLRDTLSNTTRLVSVNRTGVGVGDSYSIIPQMTPDARFVVFYSAARNLVANDANGRVDVFLRDMNSNVVELISVNRTGSASANDDSYPDGISDDGRYVAFDSYATDLHAADTTDISDFYVHDRLLGTNILCSAASGGSGAGNNDSYFGQISANGSAVVFSSYASNLVPGDTNGERDVFSYNLASGQAQLVSVNAGGNGSGNFGSSSASISADGRFVVFESDATDLLTNAAAGSNSDIFLRDLVSQTTTLVSADCHGDGGGDDFSYAPAFSADGRYIVFSSYAMNLLAGEFVENEDNVFRHDRLTGANELLSFNHQRTGAGNYYSYGQTISGNGRSVAFHSTASNLVASDANGSVFDIFLWREMSSSAQLSISFTTTAGGAASLSVKGEPGTLYVIERTINLATPSSWAPIGTTNAPASGYFEFVDPALPNGGAFYRVAQP